MSIINLNIFSRIKNYCSLSDEIKGILSKDHSQASNFQKIFNLTVDKMYQDIMDFERENIDKFESNIFRLKKIFEKRYRHYFLYGDYIKWCAQKPFGYAGDFKIIDDIYQNQVKTTGFDFLWDKWFQQLAASDAVRERKEDFKKMIYSYAQENKGKNLRMMNLASGPAREIKELLEENESGLFSKIIFDCYDQDVNSLNYAKQLLNSPVNVNFFQKNAIRLALKKDIESEVGQKYDLIYSTGLFDYLDEKIAVRLVKNLARLLNPGGIMLISNVRDKYVSSSSIWMEWIGEWYLIYRKEEDFAQIFLNSGFLKSDIEIIPQKSKIMQYCLARK